MTSSKMGVLPSVAEDRRKVLEKDKFDKCCGRKCVVVTVVALCLFVIFVTLPAGAFLIIHGNRKGRMGFKVGGALVVVIPILITFVICLVLCLRRKSSRKLTITRSASQI